MLKHIKGSIFAFNQVTKLIKNEGIKSIPGILDPRGWYFDINGKKTYGTMYKWIKHFYINGVIITTDDLELSE